jgi:hypothetical protein
MARTASIPNETADPNDIVDQSELAFKLKALAKKLVDPLADKLLLVSSFLILAFLGHIPRWLAILVISRDVILLVGFAVCAGPAEAQLREVEMRKQEEAQ